MSITAVDLEARRRELWAELREIYRATGDGPHFEHLRNIDSGFFAERRRLGLIDVGQAAQHERTLRERREWERSHPEIVQARKEADEKRRQDAADRAEREAAERAAREAEGRRLIENPAELADRLERAAGGRKS